MKRSRAPSSVAAAAAASSSGGGGRSVRGAPATRGNSGKNFSGGGGGGRQQQQQQQQEESQPSLEVDVGMEDFHHGVSNSNSNSDSQASVKPALRRRSSRNSPASSNSSSGGGSAKKRKTVGGSGSGSSNTSPQSRGSPEKMQKGASARSSERSPRSPRSPPPALSGTVGVGANGTTSYSSPFPSRGAAERAATGVEGVPMNRRGGGGGAKAAYTEKKGGGDVEEGGVVGGGVVKPEAHEGRGVAGGAGKAGMSSPPSSPPPKKKKKYIRNPETHKEYRTRMEAELSQARRMLEEGNAAMVELARDYKRQQAIIDTYRNEDTSLQSFSQLTQSQPTKQQQQQQQLQQQQQQQLQQLQLVQQQQEHAGRGGGGGGGGGSVIDGAGPAACKPAVETLAESAAHEPADLDPDMSQLSQDAGVEFSQASALSISHLADADEPLSQATQWLAVFKDSQEAWSLDDILLSPGGTGEEAKSGEEEEEEAIDSVEAVALAAEALSPSKQQQHQQGAAGAAGGSLCPHLLSPLSATNISVAQTADLSPMHPPPPLLPGVAGGRTATAAAAAAAAAGRGGGAGLAALLSPGGSMPLAADVQQAVAAGVAGGVVRVGVGCLVTNPKKPGCVLIGKRKGSIGAGTWALPGGHLEIGEEWPRCAEREVLEETGLEVETPTFSWVMNNPNMEGGKHYVTIFMLAAVTNPDKEPALMEPDKCEVWSWEPWKSLGDRPGQKRKSRARGGSCGGGGGRWGLGECLFHPLAALRSTTYDPFKGVL